jgi:hypothetical protein
MDGLRQSGCTARGGMRRASRAPPETSRDPDHVGVPFVRSRLWQVGAFFYSSSDAHGVKRRAPPQFLSALSPSAETELSKSKQNCKVRAVQGRSTNRRVQSATGCGKNMANRTRIRFDMSRSICAPMTL